MNTADVRELVLNALYLDDEANEVVASSCSFDEAGVLAMNDGLVLRMRDGSEFQLTIVQSA